MPTVKDILRALDAQYPLSRAANWDKVGLQIGDEAAQVSRVLVAHEINDDVLDEAADCQAIVIYHPLIFRALENLNFQNHTARLVAKCIAQNLNVIAVHTALDHALPNSLGNKLGISIGLSSRRGLRPDGYEALLKIAVFVPPKALEKVSEAMWEAGAGNIGNYERASFRMSGTGTFRPKWGANPYQGEVGKDEAADECRFEVIVPAGKREAVITAMKGAHPYEEVAYDVYPLQNEGIPYGAACMGYLGKPVAIMDYARVIAEWLQAPSTRVVVAKEMVQKIACVPGSGASYISAAAKTGCDCLVTGDIKHHDALQAKALGISIIDVTHAATERATIPMLAEALDTLDVEIVRSEIETNPFQSG